MGIRARISAVLGFKTIPTTTLVVLVYAASFLSVFLTDSLPDVPKDTKGLDLDQAYSDLHLVTFGPHPFTSHSNDIVHSYILSRLENIASNHSHVHVLDDTVTNTSWAQSDTGYHAGVTNILVKIDGTDPKFSEKGGVLFSAHFDSVSTAPGATDDGMGVATLMQMVQYFALRRPQRTVIFNINNAEENGLVGAHVFLEHPWSEIPNIFLNLEGAGAGGRPILFRTTSFGILSAFTSVPHPHSNVLSQDAMSRRAVRSGTDYSVYTSPAASDQGMDGLDLAFYQGRSKYHTKYDSVSGIVGGRKALWAMMEITEAAAVALANRPEDENVSGSGNAVYFDIFNAALICFSMRGFFVYNIVLLVVGPIAILLLSYCISVTHHTRSMRHSAEHRSGGNEWTRIRSGLSNFSWLKDVWALAKFWLAFVVIISLQVALTVGYVFLNPFIAYSHPFVVFTSYLALTYLGLWLTMNLPTFQHKATSEHQKLIILLEMYLLSWLFLIAATVALNKLQVGGFYFVTAWNSVLLLGCVLALVESISGVHGTSHAPELEHGEEQVRHVSGIRYEVPENRDHEVGGAAVEIEPTEITPLIAQQRAAGHVTADTGQSAEDGEIGWWIVQLLMVVPVPVILALHIVVMLLQAMANTLADGNNPLTLYAMVAFFAFFIVLPAAPFSVKLHYALFVFILLVFVGSTLFAWFAFPFTLSEPLKVYFKQQVIVNPLYGNASLFDSPRAITTLTGPLHHVDRLIIPQLPSSWSKDVDCVPDKLKLGLWACSWEGGLMPAPGHVGDSVSSENLLESAPTTNWLYVNITSRGSGSARISVKGVNARGCRLYFDNHPVARFTVHGSQGEDMQRGWEIPEDGLSKIVLYGRDWEQEFVVDVSWSVEKHGSGLSGRAACEWTEYVSATAGEISTGGRIPAFEEVLSFLPQWAAASKSEDGLVEAWHEFSI